MLTTVQAQAQRRRRSPPSLKQQYQEYILQRVEGFKNSLSREELLRLGDEAVAELQAAAEGQFVLTEVLMLDSVDRLIMRRLSLRPYRRWRQQFLKLRAAQREPTHWGLSPRGPVARIRPRLEPGDSALVIGPAVEAAALLLAAHEVAVTFVTPDLGSVERLESRVAEETLGALFTGYVGQVLEWLPPTGAVQLVVMDLATVTDASPLDCVAAVRELEERTAPGGIHILRLPPGDNGRPGPPPEWVAGAYEGWEQDRALCEQPLTGWMALGRLESI